MTEKVIRKCSIERWGLAYVQYIHREIEESFNTRHLSRLEKSSKNLPFPLRLFFSHFFMDKMRKKQSKMMEDKEMKE
jgi:hypothetical protein